MNDTSNQFLCCTLLKLDKYVKVTDMYLFVVYAAMHLH